MITKLAARVTAVAILIGGFPVTSLLYHDDTDEVDRVSSSQPEPPTSPQFTIRSRPGALTVSGHTVSEVHERALLQVVDASYPYVSLSTDFHTLDALPDGWSITTAQVLTATSAMLTSSAEISGNTILIHGVVAEESVWQQHLASLTQALPANISLSVDRVLLDNDIDVVSLCEQAFSGFKPGPINFEESSTIFRSSAFPNLAKIVAIAAACTEAIVHITGHTDSSGSEVWNQHLSLKRAAAVGDYIRLQGIGTDRLRISGAGASSPIATNATRYGRGFNRRIEIEFSSTSAP